MEKNCQTCNKSKNGKGQMTYCTYYGIFIRKDYNKCDKHAYGVTEDKEE